MKQDYSNYYGKLTQNFSSSLSLESDLTVRERAEPQRVARRELESLIERSVPDGPVATLLGKIEGGLDHWLTLASPPALFLWTYPPEASPSLDAISAEVTEFR